MSRKTKGSAIIELAICLPVLLLIVFGTIELSTSIFLKQTLVSAAHDGVLSGMKTTTVEQDIIDRVNSVLTARNITGCTISVDPTGADFVAQNPGEFFTVNIQKSGVYQYINLTGVNVSVTSQRN